MLPFPEVPWNQCDRSRVTDAQIAQWRDECVALDAEHDAAVAERSAAFKSMKDAASLVFYPGSKESKAIGRMRLPFYRDKPSRRLADLERDVARYREADAEKRRKASDESERQAIAARAVLWLAAHGRQPGTDYDATKAIEVADGIAFDEEVNRRVAEIEKSGELIEFDGQNCDECDGWDGDSRRCACGNRRVSWVASYGHSFEKPCVYGEAY